MLAKSLLVSSLAAVALANAAAPAVTAAPAQRRQFGDLGDDLDGFLDKIGTDVKDIVGGIGTKAEDIVGDIGTGVDNLASRGSTLAGGLADKFATATDCAAAAAKLTDMPMPDGDLGSALMSASDEHTGSPCDIGDALPKSLTDDYAEYQSEVLSWYAENTDKISAVVKACPTMSAEISEFTSCLAGQSEGGKDGKDGEDGEDSKDGKDGEDSKDGDDGDDSSAARLTGIVAAVAGAAVGAVALLL